MENFLLKNRKNFLILCQNLFFLFLSLILLGQFTNLIMDKFISISWLIYFCITLPFVWFFFFIKKNEQFYIEKVGKYFKYLFIILIILIIFSNTNINLPGYFKFFQNSLEFLNKYSSILLVLTSNIGYFSFYFKRKEINKSLEQEILSEKFDEKQRLEKFIKKFSKINKIPLLGYLAKQIYKEGNYYLVFLMAILISASLLIYPHLGSHDIYHDEGKHMEIIDSLIKGDGFYLRNYIKDEPTELYKQGYLTNAGSALTYLFFQESIFGARFFVATIGLFCLLLVYLVFKEVFTKKMSLIITLFFSYNVIFIYLTRFLRPYSLFLFFYLLVVLFVFKLPKCLHNNKRYFVILTWSFLFTILALTEREMAKILLIILPFCLLILFITYKQLLLSEIKQHRTKLLLVLLSGLILLGVLNFSNIIHIGLIGRQITEQFSLEIFKNPTTIYYDYFFKNQIKNTSLAYLLFGIGVLFSIFFLNFKKNTERVFLMLFLIIPSFLNIYLLSKGEDFRYIYHILPFFLSLITFGIYLIVSLYIKNLNLKTIIILFILTLIISTPSLPLLKNSNNLAIKSVAEWSGIDGKIYLHPRTVPPEYSKAFVYINDNQKPGDLVISVEPFNKIISPSTEVEYYTIRNIWNYDNIFENNRNHEQTNFFDLTKTKSRIWFTGAYIHMIDPKINDYLLNNCIDIAEKIGIQKFNYNMYYKERFHWPNLFLCNF